MNLKIVTLLLALSLSLLLPATALTSKKFSGTYRTETIRELWQMCSLSQKMNGVAQHIYYPICDCMVDVMREHYDNATVLKDMKKNQADELAALLKLSCNKWKLR